MGVVKPTTKIFSTEYKLLSEWEASEEDISSQEFVDVYDCTKKRLLKMYSTPYKLKELVENKESNDPKTTTNVDQSAKPFIRKKAKKEKKKNNKKKK